MKNLLYALEVLDEIDIKINFDIWGPISDKDYWEKCQEKISNLPENIMVKYMGRALL